ncbi:diagnostic antigen gp50 [Echinococcus multilocularis]|uniref:Diagnostic antigen gp50 n=1 Tax=Echinococcus multilocularis TaxID=6211 RepID=A0A068Y6Y9_ECHMU|nr:diagnostic antigen gp50 [Echinococcus multilocularis]
MLAITAVLIFVTSTSGDKVPKLWGSRVVGKPSGPSDTMYYEYNDKFETVLVNDSVLGVMTIESGRCVLSGRYHWGTPCSRGANYANITLQNVTAQKIMEMDEDTLRTRVASTTFFVPRCNFTRPPAGEVDVWTSFPLSRLSKTCPRLQLSSPFEEQTTTPRRLLISAQCSCAFGEELNFCSREPTSVWIW